MKPFDGADPNDWVGRLIETYARFDQWLQKLFPRWVK